MICTACSNRVRIDSVQGRLEKFTRTHWTLYSGLIFVVTILTAVVISALLAKDPKPALIDNPQVGDVYAVHEDGATNAGYYFLRISQLHNDQVMTYHSSLLYDQPVTHMDAKDFFLMEEELIFTKPELKAMLDKGEITQVYRNYGEQQGFKRLK